MSSALRTSFTFRHIFPGFYTQNMNRKTQLTLSGSVFAILFIYALLSFAIPGFIKWASSTLGSLGFLFLFFHWALGLYGIYVMREKGYLKGVSVVLFMFVGWWFLVILVGLGAITLFIAALLPEKKRCRHCREVIHKNATRCPKCQGDLAVAAVTT